jgi:hypothetical protein
MGNIQAARHGGYLQCKAESEIVYVGSLSLLMVFGETL